MRLLHDPAFLSATIGGIYDCVRDPARWEGILAELGAEIGARRAFLGLVTATGEAPRIAVMHNVGTVEEMLRWGPVNPMLPLGLAWPVDRAMVVSRDVGLEGFRKSRFYQGYVAPRGDLDCIAFTVTQEGNAFGHWMLVTQEDRGPITDAEAAGLELVAPHIRRAVEISDLLGVQALSAATYRAALDALDSAVLILDGARRALHANPRAEQALARGAVLRSGPDGRIAGATEAVERALRRATAPDAARGGIEAAVTGGDGEERLLFALPLDLGGDDAAPVTLLVLRHPREDTRNPIAIAARTFGLSPAQVQVLSFLAQGHAPEEIGGILGIAPSTVRSHLGELFRRTDTSRQAELVARALSFASPLRAAEGG